MPQSSILVVEDDNSLADVLVYNLERDGYEVALSRDGQDGLNRARLKCPDLIILDLMLPQIDGLEVCRQLRADPVTKNTPILMLTAKSEETDQVVGFAMGADDYVTKPFSVRVLSHRIKSLLRRQKSSDGDKDVSHSQGVTIDRIRHRALAGDEVLNLTPSEFCLLDVMVRNPGRAFSRSELIDVARGEDVVVLERTIDVHIRSLRKKLNANANLIETVRGIGYRFRDPSRGENEDATPVHDAG